MQDIVIRAGFLADGSGNALKRADVAVKNGIISEIGDLSNVQAHKTLNAEGLVVAPGFIDLHAHSDTCFLEDDSAQSKLFQGVTTEVTGQCGASPFPAGETGGGRWKSFDELVRAFEEKTYRSAINQAMLAGHGTIRAHVIGVRDVHASDEEISEMENVLRRDMLSGAWGMSLGLEYAPGFFADTTELTRLAKVVSEYDGVVTCHMRNEGLHISEALDELFSIGEESGAHVHVSHLKIDNFRAHGKAPEVWRMIESARDRGIRVSCDMYPFTASCTSLSIRCPKWSREGGDEALAKRLKGPDRERIVEGIRAHYFNAERAQTCLINDDAGLFPEIVGKNLREIAEDIFKTTDYAEAAAEILVRTNGGAGGIFFVMDKDDMMYFMKKDVGIGSDGYALSGDETKIAFKPHPRSYAAITEFLSLARDHRIMPVEKAVERVTGMAAGMIGFRDRGLIRKGYAADITVFDPDRIASKATYLTPVRLSEGVKHVLVNGEIAMADGRQTEVRSGKLLRKR